MNDHNTILSSFLEIKLNTRDDFLRIRETLSRIGLTTKGKNVLTQTCHILHKQGRYYCVHFLELYALDGKEVNITEEDILRRNRIANLLAQWGLAEIVSPQNFQEMIPLNRIKILSFKEKDSWELRSLYQLGNN